jgi:hypothetical protein
LEASQGLFRLSSSGRLRVLSPNLSISAPVDRPNYQEAQRVCLENHRHWVVENPAGLCVNIWRPTAGINALCKSRRHECEPWPSSSETKKSFDDIWERATVMSIVSLAVLVPLLSLPCYVRFALNPGQNGSSAGAH